MAIAVYPICNWGGLEITDIQYGIEDYVIYKDMQYKKHKAKVYTTTSGRFYFISCYGRERVYLDECIAISRVRRV